MKPNTVKLPVQPAPIPMTLAQWVALLPPGEADKLVVSGSFLENHCPYGVCRVQYDTPAPSGALINGRQAQIV